MFTRLYKILFSLLLLLLSLFIKRNKKMLAFGSWDGQLYLDNSRYLFEYVIENYKDFVCIWVGSPKIEALLPKSPNVIFVKKNSLRSMRYLLRCKFMFCTQMHNEDLCSYNVFRKATITYLHHGMPIKKWGADSAEGHKDFTPRGVKKLVKRIDASYISYDYFTVSSKSHALSSVSSLDYRGCTLEKCLPFGTPRNDFLIRNKNNAFYIGELKKQYASTLHFNGDKKVIMYLPTYRRKGDGQFSFFNIKEEEMLLLESLLDKYGFILIEKSHYAARRGQIDDSKSPLLIQSPLNVNIQEMLLFTDVLISDYSGAFLDFLLLDRPVIHFIYDYEYYSNIDSGLYYSLDEFVAGEAPRTFEELLNSIKTCFDGIDNCKEEREHVLKRFLEYEKGVASQSLFNRIVLEAS